MADYPDSKTFGTKGYPVEGFKTTPLFRRCEPMLTPDLLKSRCLKGIDFSKYSDEELNQEIVLATNEFELMSNLTVNKVVFKERIPFDRAAYKSFVFMKLSNGPIRSVDELLIESSNGESIYQLPADWIEIGFAHKRQINLIPILSVFGAAGLRDGQASNAGLIFIQAVNNFRWLPAFYTVVYTGGMTNTDGEVPIVVNDIIGMGAAIEILNSLQANILFSSTSIGQDGISQSASGPGPQTFQTRIASLTERRDRMLKKLKAEFSQKYFMSNI
jgi:hypothetical protein